MPCPGGRKSVTSSRLADVTRSFESRFERHLGALRAFVAREGHTNVPYGHHELIGADDVHLGRWVAYVRSRERQGRLSGAQRAQLDQIPGWHWELRRPGPEPKRQRNTEIKNLRAQGVSLAVIAESYGLSKQRVYQISKGVAPA